MAFTGKLAGVDGLKLLFGKRDKETTRYEQEFTMGPDVKILRGEWPDWTPAHRADLANGQEVRCCGVAGNAVEGVCHSVCIIEKPSHKTDTVRRQMEEEKKAAKAK